MTDRDPPRVSPLDPPHVRADGPESGSPAGSDTDHPAAGEPFFAGVWRRQSVPGASLLCVGLDPDLARMPACIRRADPVEAVFDFCRAIVDATAPHAAAFKPQIAYFAAMRAERALEALIDHVHQAHPRVPVVLDAKRGDIGSTAEQYAREAFERYRADALTLSPYMGFDSVEPYLAWPGKGLYLLCRTSNPGGSDLQSLPVVSSCAGEPDAAHRVPLYEHLARLVDSRWDPGGRLGLVVGATFPAELASVRRAAPDIPLLVPGIGAQGGDIDATLRAGLSSSGGSLLVNSSRGVIYAGSGDDFASEAARAAEATARALDVARRQLIAERH